jgi:hypothetical protein
MSGWQPQPRPDDLQPPAVPTPKKRRRWPWVVGAVAAVIVVVSIASGNSGSTDPTTSGSSNLSDTSDTSKDDAVSNSTNEEHPPARDVKVAKCEVDNSYDLNMATASLKVTNHSSKTSDYVITVEFVSGDGTRVGESAAILNALRPSQSAKTDATGESGGERHLTCKVTQVERFSSTG